MENLNKYIDHTLLKPDATQEQIRKLCEEANEYKFASACIAPLWIRKANEYYLTNIPATTVIGFPHGNITPLEKTFQASRALSDGAKEFDYVVSIGDIKSGFWHNVEKEILTCVTDLNSCITFSRRNTSDFTKKYIVEVGYLTDEELYKVADILIKNKIDFIKTCTGYGPRNVEVDDIKKIKAYVGDRIRIKASGGIKTRMFAEDLIAAGADRIGCSASVSIMNER